VHGQNKLDLVIYVDQMLLAQIVGAVAEKVRLQEVQHNRRFIAPEKGQFTILPDTEVMARGTAVSEFMPWTLNHGSISHEQTSDKR
jgi:hypothetical protein